jgi:hypothetical protein
VNPFLSRFILISVGGIFMPVTNLFLAVLLVTQTLVSGTVGAIDQNGATFLIPGATVSLTTPEGRVPE